MVKFYKCFKNEISDHINSQLNDIDNAKNIDKNFNLKHSWFYLFYLLDKKVSENGFSDYFKSNSHSIKNDTIVSETSEVKDYLVNITRELVNLNNLEDKNVLIDFCNILETVSFDSSEDFLKIKTLEFLNIKYDILYFMDGIDC